MAVRPIILLFVVAVAGFTATSFAEADSELHQLSVWSFPRVDEMYFKYEGDWLQMAKRGEYDAMWDAFMYGGLSRELEGMGWNYSLVKSAFGPIIFLGINCRDVTPESSGKFANYHNRTPGFSLYPLNLTAFRKALRILAGNKSVRENMIKDIFGPLCSALDSIIPPTNRYWFNPYPSNISYSSAEAYKILVQAGFSNSSGYWTCPNGQELRQIYLLVSADSPTGPEYCMRTVELLNKFFGKMSDGKSDYFLYDLLPFDRYARIVYGNRDFDIAYVMHGIDVFPSHLYRLFHVESDRPLSLFCWNAFGLNNSVLNDLLWKLNFGRDPASDRLLSLEELRKVCFEAQRIIENETPIIPLLVRNRFRAFRPGLAGWNFEFSQRWLYALTHWEDLSVGGCINWLVGDIDAEWNLHPLTLHRKYQPDRYLFDAVFDPLIVFDPYTGEELPWAAIGWKREPWTDAALNVTSGMKVTFWLRDDMFWHDGVPITAEDVKFCWEYLKRFDAPVFGDVADKLVKVETEGTWIVHAYVNSTCYALIYDLADTALLLPKHLWGNVTDPLAFRPWEHVHPLFDGSRESWPGWWPYDWPLTMYVGSGPFIFHNWNSTARPQYIHVVRNPCYWVTCPVVSGITAKPYAFVGAPVNFTVSLVSVLDKNATVELSIYVDDVLWDVVNVTLEPFGYERLGPYTLKWLSPGIHTIKAVHTESITGISFTYTEMVVVTVPEDLNRDLHVDIQDIFIAANAFGSYPAHPRWNPQADINKDNYIGIDDIYLIAKKFGWTGKEEQ